VKLVDLNLLLYAVNRDSPQHARAKAWIEEMLSGEETIALPWVVILGFLRITTHARVLPRPLTPEQGVAIVDAWLERPQVISLDPTDEHWVGLRQLLAQTGTAGNLTTDAHLATLAIEHDAELCSTDGDFVRFTQLRWRNPLAE
jgi:toxin-antitoxin system PIN domain toxin